MSVSVATQELRSTPISGTVFAMNTATGAVDLTTKAGYANLGTGITRFSPTATRATRDTIPAVDGAAANMGWRMDADVAPLGDPVQFIADTWPVVVKLHIDAGVTCTATLTAIAYVNGTEVGRGTLATQTIGTTAALYTINISTGAVTSSANPRIQVEVYVNITLGATAVGGYNVVLTMNDGASQIDPGLASVRASRVPTTEAIPSMTNTASRVVANVRRATETLPAIVDMPLRTGTSARLTTEAISVPLDSPRRAVAHVRPTSEIVAGVGDSSSRTTAVSRRPIEMLPVPTDTASRTGVSTRFTVDNIPIPADTPQRVVTAVRQLSETVPSIADSPARVVSATRNAQELVAVISDAPRRLLAVSRLIAEMIQAVVDTPARQASFPRGVSETIPQVSDTPTRLLTFSRPATSIVAVVGDATTRVTTYARLGAEVIPVPVETLVRSGSYTRSVAHDFSDCPVVPPVQLPPPTLILVGGDPAIHIGGILYERV
jgi:hypothetical protein